MSEVVPGDAVIHLRVVDRVGNWDIVAVHSETLLYGNEAKSEVTLSDELSVDLDRGATDFICGKSELNGPVVPIEMRHRGILRSVGTVWLCRAIVVLLLAWYFGMRVEAWRKILVAVCLSMLDCG